MKKRLIALTMLAAIAISAVACGTKEASQNQEIDPGNNESAVNPWRDCTEDEAYQYAPNGFSAPEAATNVRWSLMEAGDLEGMMTEIKRRERELKQSRAKTLHPGEFDPYIWYGGGLLDYRFGNAKVIISDIFESEGIYAKSK